MSIAPPPAEEPDDQPTDERASWLYIRLGAGIAFPFGPDIADAYGDRDGQELHFSGVSFATEWMAGRALLPGLVLGLGAASETVASGTVRTHDEDERSLDNSLHFAVIGAFADIYPAPPAGLHMQALFGLAHLSRSDDLGGNDASGFGAMLGVGYDLAVGRRWNVGVLGRMAFSSLGMDDVAGESPSPAVYEPGLLFTATFRPER